MIFIKMNAPETKLHYSEFHKARNHEPGECAGSNCSCMGM